MKREQAFERARHSVNYVDVQNDFCHEEGACTKMGRDVTGAQAIIPAIKELIAECRDREVPVIFIQMTQDEHTISEAWKMKPRPSGGVSLPVTQKNTWGAEFYKLAPEHGIYYRRKASV
jgi:ureidoacrylate peracid hydrolase